MGSNPTPSARGLIRSPSQSFAKTTKVLYHRHNRAIFSLYTFAVIRHNPAVDCGLNCRSSVRFSEKSDGIGDGTGNRAADGAEGREGKEARHVCRRRRALSAGHAGRRQNWVLRYMLDRKPRWMGLGPLALYGLQEARARALDARRKRHEGIDPIEARRAERARQRLEAAKAITFKQCAEAYIAAHRAGWRNDKHAAQWSATLSTYAHPVIGALPVQAVDTGLVLKVLEPIWTTKPETASRLRGRIESILDFAKVRGYRDGENPARWRGHLDKLLPARSKVRQVEHHAALPYAELAAFLASLREQEGIAARALEFLILTAARTGEVIGARWNEIDLLDKVWTVPAARMKAHREHRVPLSRAGARHPRGNAGGSPRRRRRRFCVPRPQGGDAAFQHGVFDAVAPHGPRRSDGARLPRHVQDLGERAHVVSKRNCRGELGARDRRQGRASLPARRPVREAAPAHAAMGDVLHHRARARTAKQRDAAARFLILLPCGG